MFKQLTSYICTFALALLLSACGTDDGGSRVPPPTTPVVSPPTISTQPSAASVTAPASATFTVSATGTAPLAYQWRRNGADIAGAASSSYTLTTTSLSDTGAAFTVRVSNSAGTVESASVTLTVTAPAAGTLTSQTLTSSGVTRDYLLYTPSGLPTGAVPLVVVLHGGTQDAAITASETLPTFAWRTIADRDKIMVAFPNGVGNQWNDCRSDTVGRSTAKDTAFIADMIDMISSQRVIDATRIYVSGSSNGGMMSYRAALELGSKIAGVGAVIANMPVDPLKECPVTASNAMSIVIMNGTADPLMPFNGGVVSMTSDAGTVISANASRDFWVSANGCNLVPVTENLPDTDPSDGITVTRETYSGCRGSHKVAFFRNDGGGHVMPSLRYFNSTAKQNRDIEGAEEIWKILKDARRN
jgi:polyhydroxybutyrate depolymerase